ncbi:hypothetical protein SAMN06265795_12521 [Noviherbaspirillum humi]|uniref:Uncharacterized protein n=1 Tax=Noviherbaspirillum humi TaxID=1688639 RepID=A0A239LRD7_9BURK|nr:hypothetical protein SAMN06265795_12521 [Noviherbaspirillum humi]
MMKEMIRDKLSTPAGCLQFFSGVAIALGGIAAIAHSLL